MDSVYGVGKRSDSETRGNPVEKCGENVRGTGVDPSDFSGIHVQILANRCCHAHDTALEEGLLANGHCGS